jgi:uncharacterized protein
VSTSEQWASCLYEGSVRHRRMAPLQGEFRYPLFMAYLDLDELPRLFEDSWLWSARRPALAWFRRADHLGDPSLALTDAVADLVRERAGTRPEGPIRLLTHLRYFGYCFNPVSFYYCYDAGANNITAVVAHVTNTPWGESHPYVMAVNAAADHGSVALIRGELEKRLHVSPLMGMDQVYDWRLTEPSERLSVHIESRSPDGEATFDATLSLARREMTPWMLRRALVRYPVLTARMTARIYAQALALKLRGASYFPHPDSGAAAT